MSRALIPPFVLLLLAGCGAGRREVHFGQIPGPAFRTALIRFNPERGVAFLAIRREDGGFTAPALGTREIGPLYADLGCPVFSIEEVDWSRPPFTHAASGRVGSIYWYRVGTWETDVDLEIGRTDPNQTTRRTWIRLAHPGPGPELDVLPLPDPAP